jgi:hypothetical protein
MAATSEYDNDVGKSCRLRGRLALDIRRGGSGKTGLASFFDLPNARLIRKIAHQGDRNPILYIVAVSNADQAVAIIRNGAADNGDAVEDLGRVAGFLVQAFNLAPGEFIRVDAHYKPQAELNRAQSG